MTNTPETLQYVSTYTRSDAIADGFLVDVTTQAAAAGFTIPLAITRAAWSESVEWTASDAARQAHPRQADRLRNLLISCRLSTRLARNSDHLVFEVMCVPRDGTPNLVPVKLKAVIGPSDTIAPALTIMLSDED